METMNSLRFEFNSICRLCIQLLESEKVSPIFNNEMYGEQVSLPERIRYCSSVEVCEGDGLPNKICSSCLMKLNQSFVFRNQCVLADNTLKKLRDVTFNLDDVSHFANVDMESQVIALEDVSKESPCSYTAGLTDNQSAAPLENFERDAIIDEFDNSKNGRHKRNINKSKDRGIQRVKICKNGLSKLNKVNADFLNEANAEPNAASDAEDFTERRLKRRRKVKLTFGKKYGPKEGESSEAECSGNETKCKARRSRKSKIDREKFDEADIEIKAEVKEELDDINEAVENFTVEPDVLLFGENAKKELHGGGEKEERRVQDKRPSEKITKDKCSGLKRGRPRKYSVVREKPSSYTCDYCQKVYPSEGGWRYHIHTMHNENYQPFICDLCGKAFKVKKNLEGHKNSIHYHLKHHLCDLCGRGFASKYALKVHKIWHNDEKNFPCDICGTKFRTRGKMNTHRSIHGGPKKFMCHVCSRDFRWKKDFEIHMRTHTGEKPFKCSHCGKAFSSLTNMKKHERNHMGKLRMPHSAESYNGTDPDIAGHDNVLYKPELGFHYGCTQDDVRARDFS